MNQPSVEIKPGFDSHGTPGFWVLVDREYWVIVAYLPMAEAVAAGLRVQMLSGFRPFIRKTLARHRKTSPGLDSGPGCMVEIYRPRSPEEIQARTQELLGPAGPLAGLEFPEIEVK